LFLAVLVALATLATLALYSWERHRDRLYNPWLVWLLRGIYSPYVIRE
jgi:hypothetical protein